MSKPTRLWWRICPRLYHTVAPGIARAAYAARWPSPSESWCRTWRRCRKHRDCPRRGLSPVPWQQTLWWLVYLLSQHWAVFKALRLAATHSLSHRELVCVCGYLVCVQFRGHHCNEVLKHLVIWDASTQETIIEGFMKKKNALIHSMENPFQMFPACFILWNHVTYCYMWFSLCRPEDWWRLVTPPQKINGRFDGRNCTL